MNKFLAIALAGMLVGCQSVSEQYDTPEEQARYDREWPAVEAQMGAEMARLSVAQTLAAAPYSGYQSAPAIPMGPPCTFNALTYSTACPGW